MPACALASAIAFGHSRGRHERPRHRGYRPHQALRGDAGGRPHRFHHRARRDRGAAGRQRRRQDHDDLDAARPAAAERRLGAGARRRHAARPLSRAVADEFLLALCRAAAPLDRAREPPGLWRALWRQERARPDRGARRRPADRGVPRPQDRQPQRRPEDPRGTRQGADQRAGAAAARRAHGVAGSRHRRLGARLSRDLPRAHRLYHPAGIAQHGRGRAALLRGAHAAPGPHRRPRQPRRADRPLWPRHARGGLPRHRPRQAARGGRAMSAAVSIAFSPRRVGAMVLRHLYLFRGSWPRAFEIVYWPILTMVLWGFTSQFLVTNSSWVARAGGVLIYAVLLWEVMFRGQLGVAFSFLEEMWSRNLGHLFVSPLRPYEWVLSLLAMSFIRVTLGIG